MWLHISRSDVVLSSYYLTQQGNNGTGTTYSRHNGKQLHTVAAQSLRIPQRPSAIFTAAWCHSTGVYVSSQSLSCESSKEWLCITKKCHFHTYIYIHTYTHTHTTRIVQIWSLGCGRTGNTAWSQYAQWHVTQMLAHTSCHCRQAWIQMPLWEFVVVSLADSKEVQ